MKRLMEYTVFAGLGTAGRFARGPTSRSPVLVKATTDGTVRPPSAEAMTVGSPPSITATTLFVVPRSIPMILPMFSVSPAWLLLVWLVVGVDQFGRPVSGPVVVSGSAATVTRAGQTTRSRRRY